MLDAEGAQCVLPAVSLVQLCPSLRGEVAEHGAVLTKRGVSELLFGRAALCGRLFNRDDLCLDGSTECGTCLAGVDGEVLVADVSDSCVPLFLGDEAFAVLVVDDRENVYIVLGDVADNTFKLDVPFIVEAGVAIRVGVDVCGHLATDGVAVAMKFHRVDTAEDSVDAVCSDVGRDVSRRTGGEVADFGYLVHGSVVVVSDFLDGVTTIFGQVVEGLVCVEVSSHRDSS